MREWPLTAERIKATEWRDGTLRLLDQYLLPQEEARLEYESVAEATKAIRDTVVRGVPAIGISAAYGIVLGARTHLAQGGDWRAALEENFRLPADSRPTAVNLFWVLNHMCDRLERMKEGDQPLAALEVEAISIHESDREANLTITQLGMELVRKQQGSSQNIPTHCNTDVLATSGFGTVLGVIRTTHLEGLVNYIYTDETRPWLQGSRLTAWGLANEGIPISLNVDSVVAHLAKTENITWVIVGADRITANGDVVNKTGTYQLTVSAIHHGVRFMVVAPSLTIDMNLESGEDIPIEERDGRELLEIGGQRVAAEVDAYNPVSDVTPADLIDTIVTERSVVERPDAERMAALMSRKRLH